MIFFLSYFYASASFLEGARILMILGGYNEGC